MRIPRYGRIHTSTLPYHTHTNNASDTANKKSSQFNNKLNAITKTILCINQRRYRRLIIYK
nr:MAG TPA: hypothetical protein [Caudoviricetes sp.]